MGKNQSLNDQIEENRIVIWNASGDEVIRTRFEPFGFDEARHTANKALFNETKALLTKNESEHGEWRAASEAFNTAETNARKSFNRIRQVLMYWYDANSTEAIALNLYTNKLVKYTDFVQAAIVVHKTVEHGCCSC